MLLRLYGITAKSIFLYASESWMKTKGQMRRGQKCDHRTQNDVMKIQEKKWE
jgi:hypothetical protein